MLPSLHYSDGTTWTHQYLYPFYYPPTDPAQEPLDAVTIDAPDGPRILVIYGYVSGQHPYYDYIYAVDWNPALPQGPTNPSIHNFANDGGNFVGRVSLSVGTKASGDAGAGATLAAGALKPAVQLFGQTSERFAGHNAARHAEYVHDTVANGSGIWAWDGTRIKYFDDKNPSLIVYPWSESLCEDGNAGKQAIRERMVLLGGFGWWLAKTPFPFTSDFLIPQNQVDVYCSSPVDGILTNTSEIRKNYWTLVGVILGSPPFSDNSATGNIYGKLSSVLFDQSTSTSSQTTTTSTSTVSTSVGLKIFGGFKSKSNRASSAWSASGSPDVSYQHSWENKHGPTSTATMEISDEYGAGVEIPATFGHPGWAIFSAPHVYVQDWTVYGYDYVYNASTGGTALKFWDGSTLDIQTQTTKGTPDYIPEQFDLQDPSGNNQSLPAWDRSATPTYTTTPRPSLIGWRRPISRQARS